MLPARSLLLATVLVALASVSMAQLMGGHQAASTDTPEVKRAAQFALTTLNKGNSAECSQLQNAKTGDLTLHQVLKVSTQVVAGINYHLTLQAQDKDGKTYQIEATVWYRAWMDNSNSLVPSGPAYQLTNCAHTTSTTA